MSCTSQAPVSLILIQTLLLRKDLGEKLEILPAPLLHPPLLLMRLLRLRQPTSTEPIQSPTSIEGIVNENDREGINPEAISEPATKRRRGNKGKGRAVLSID